MIKAVIFDLGDTLVDCSIPDWQVFLLEGIDRMIEVLQRNGVDVPDRDLFYRSGTVAIDKRPFEPYAKFEERVEELLTRTGLESYNHLAEELSEAFFEPLEAALCLSDDAIPTLKELKLLGYRMGLVSNSPWGSSSKIWWEALERFGIKDCFECAVFSSDLRLKKPQPEIFHYVLKRMNVRPEESVYVGDTPHVDIQGARNAGMIPILKRAPRHSYGAETDTVAVIDHLSELPALLEKLCNG